jgi:hypothetical protein
MERADLSSDQARAPAAAKGDKSGMLVRPAPPGDWVAATPLPALAGILPRYMRRATDIQAVAEAAVGLPIEPPAALWLLREIVPNIDTATIQLRRRINGVAATPDAWTYRPGQMSRRTIAALSILAVLGVGAVAVGIVTLLSSLSP